MEQAAAMTVPSDDWLRVFPGIRIPEILGYVVGTWDWLRSTYGEAVAFEHNEPTLTDNLCEALNDPERRYAQRIPCDFQPETRELRRNPDGTTSYVARADIRVILGVPGTPHLVLEFKKLDGSTDARRLYCFDGLNRFVEGKYAIGHSFGVMCGLACGDLDNEASALALYLSGAERAARLSCVADKDGNIATRPSVLAADLANFDTSHDRITPATPIGMLHVIVPCSRKSVGPDLPGG